MPLEKREFLHLRLNAIALDAYGLPDIPYPLPSSILDTVLATGGALPPPLLLFMLQLASASGGADWRGCEAAMLRLAELLAPNGPADRVIAAGEDWWVEISPFDLALPVVTLQRNDELIAALTSRNDGRLRLAAYRPLDGRSARILLELASEPLRDGLVRLRPNNWEYALDCASGVGQLYAAERGEAYLSWWGEGLGRVCDNRRDKWLEVRVLSPRPSVQVSAELGVAYAFS